MSPQDETCAKSMIMPAAAPAFGCYFHSRIIYIAIVFMLVIRRVTPRVGTPARSPLSWFLRYLAVHNSTTVLGLM